MKSHKNKDGNLVVVCDSVESRDELKDKVHASINNIEMKTPKEKRPAISIVGLSKKHDNQEVVDLLIKQNNFLKQFSTSNKIDEHMTVFSVKPIRGNPDVYQAFARVSQELRRGLRTYKDRVTLGLSTCRIYDQYHVKRCNNCQSFGHYFRNCPTPDNHFCSNCGSDQSMDCQSTNYVCTNCVKAELHDDECKHCAHDQKCPTLLRAQEKMKKSNNRDNLNMR